MRTRMYEIAQKLFKTTFKLLKINFFAILSLAKNLLDFDTLLNKMLRYTLFHSAYQNELWII